MLCAVLSLTAAAQRKSGMAFMGPSTQAMQRDDSQNPAMLWVKEGEIAWRRSDEGNGKSCASCHGDAEGAMRGVAARYPAFDAQAGRPINLAQRINRCRVRHQSASVLPAESEALLSLESYIALQSRGMAASLPDDARLQPFVERGQARWQQRMGQLNLSCAQCHDQHWGQRLGSSIIPQAHATATRSTGLNGRPWDRCSGVCATASMACGRRRIRQVRWNW